MVRASLRIALHLRRDGVERIEEEMRVELHAQRIEARLGEAALHLFQPQFTGQIVFVVSEGLARAEDGPVDQPPPKRGFVEGVGQKVFGSEHVPGHQAE